MRTALLLVAIAACGGGGGNAAGSLGGDPVGRWRALPNATDPGTPDPVEERIVLEFRADGTYVFTESPTDQTTGSWDVVDTELVLTADGDEPDAITFYANGDRFLYAAFIKDVPSAGFTGLYRRESGIAAGERETATVELRADQTVTLTASTSTLFAEGTWRNVGDDLEYHLTMVDGRPTDELVNAHSLVDGIIGLPFERI
jgi:hypothetical protein